MKTVRIGSMLLLAVLVTACRQAPATITSVTVGLQTVRVTEGRTLEEQAKGLAGVSELSWNQGMIFPFPDKSKRTFWMKGMKIPIDIIWIADDTVVGIERSAKVPSELVPDIALPRYTSPEPVNYVLEVRAGFADQFGILIGDAVSVR